MFCYEIFLEINVIQVSFISKSKKNCSRFESKVIKNIAIILLF